jgi:hypothetical protein
MEPLFRQVVIGTVPLPAQLPPAPYSREDLQRAYFEVSREHSYQQFQLLPGETGAQFLNSPDDAVLIQPGLLQVRHPITSTAEVARERTSAVLRALINRLAIQNFIAVGIKVIAHVPPPGSAREFVVERLMQGSDHIDELGPGFFGSGVTYSRLSPTGQPMQTLLIQPFLMDDRYLYVDYDQQLHQPTDVPEQLPGWLDEAFAFVRGPAMQLLERGV